MAIDTWGDKPKSQIDNSTVDEEIDAKIDDHLADPDAHLEAGQSLQSHKASEIIDHLAKSIVEDKIDDLAISSRCITTDQIVGKDIRTATDVGSTVDGVKMVPTGIEMWQDGEKKVDIPVSGDPSFSGNVKVGSLSYNKFTLQLAFQSLDGFTTDGSVAVVFPILELDPAPTTGSVASIYDGGDYVNAAFVDMAKNPIFEVVACVAGTFHNTVFVGMGQVLDGEGIGFKIVGTTIYAFWVDEDYTVHTSSLGTFSPDFWTSLRVEVDNGVAVRWYINGVLKYTRTWAQIGTLLLYGSTFQAKVTSVSNYGDSFFMTSYLYQQDF